MGYGREYGREYGRGYADGGRGRQPMGDVGRGPETNWMGRNYRSPDAHPRGYDRAFGGGYPPNHGGWDVEREGRGYDRGFRAAGYDRPYRSDGGMQGGYDRGYRPHGGYPQQGGYDRGYGTQSHGRGGFLTDPWGPYGEQLMLQSRSADWYARPWPSRYFTDHGHSSG